MKWSDDFRHHRWLDRLQRGVLLLLLAGLLLGLNQLAHQFHRRSNWSHRQEPSQLLVDLATKLSQPLEIHVLYHSENTLESQNELLELLQLFLENYRHALEKSGKSLEFFRVNLSREPNYGSGILGESLPLAAGIYLRSGDRQQQIPLGDMEQWMGNAAAEPPFQKLFEPALRRLAGENQPAVYVVEGHGERSLRDSKTSQGLWRLGQWLQSAGIRVEPLHLESLPTVHPTDSLILIDHPQSTYDAAEEALLEEFLRENSGRLLLLLPHGSHVILEDLLFEWGVLPAWEALPIKENRIGSRDILAHIFDENLEFLRPLANGGMAIKLSQPQMIRRDLGADRDDHRWLQPFLFTAAPSSEGKSPPLIPLAVAVEKRINPELSIQISQGKLVVIGGDFLSNDRILLQGNQLLFQQIMHWLLEKSPITMSEPIGLHQLALSQSQYHRLVWSLLALPLLLAAGSLARWFRRR